MKVCSRCKEEKPYELFTKNGTASDGFYSMCKTCKKSSQYFATYGITLEDYNLMFEEQKGECAICFEKPTKKLYVDHCHTTGKVRGLLCQHCNFVLGQAKDNEQILLNAITYLQERNYGS